MNNYQKEEQEFIGYWARLISKASSPKAGLRMASERISLMQGKPEVFRKRMAKKLVKTATKINPNIDWSK